MRIALVVTGGVDRSGRERVIPSLLWLIERIARRHDVIVYALQYLERPCTYALLGATVRDLGRPPGVRRQHAALVAALRADGPFDVIHAYWALPAGLVASAAGRRLGVPTLTTLDSGEFVSIPAIGYGLQTKWRQRLAVAATLRLSSASDRLHDVPGAAGPRSRRGPDRRADWRRLARDLCRDVRWKGRPGASCTRPTSIQ